MPVYVGRLTSQPESSNIFTKPTRFSRIAKCSAVYPWQLRLFTSHFLTSRYSTQPFWPSFTACIRAVLCMLSVWSTFSPNVNISFSFLMLCSVAAWRNLSSLTPLIASIQDSHFCCSLFCETKKRNDLFLQNTEVMLRTRQRTVQCADHLSLLCMNDVKKLSAF